MLFYSFCIIINGPFAIIQLREIFFYFFYWFCCFSFSLLQFLLFYLTISKRVLIFQTNFEQIWCDVCLFLFKIVLPLNVQHGEGSYACAEFLLLILFNPIFFLTESVVAIYYLAMTYVYFSQHVGFIWRLIHIMSLNHKPTRWVQLNICQCQSNRHTTAVDWQIIIQSQTSWNLVIWQIYICKQILLNVRYRVAKLRRRYMVRYEIFSILNMKFFFDYNIYNFSSHMNKNKKHIRRRCGAPESCKFVVRNHYAGINKNK